MKRFGAAGRGSSDPRLDERLRDIFDDGRTPGAPEALYTYLREVPLDQSTAPGGGRIRLAWHGLGRAGRSAAALAVVVVAAACVLAITVGLPRGLGSGSGPNAELRPLPTAPAVPAGWSFVSSFGGDGAAGTNLLQPAPRIAIHVACNGPDDLVVLVSTDPIQVSLPYGRVVQAVTFQCDADGHDSRVEMTAPSGAFREVFAILIRNPSSLADTSYIVSIETPDETAAPTASS